MVQGAAETGAKRHATQDILGGGMTPHVPEKIWHRIKDFLTAQLTGNITLHILDGKVKGAKIEEQVKVSE